MSRNQREGWYTGKSYGTHWRSRLHRSPADYAAWINPYKEMIKPRRVFRKERESKDIE